jgi:hypothetical protein
MSIKSTITLMTIITIIVKLDNGLTKDLVD